NNSSPIVKKSNQNTSKKIDMDLVNSATLKKGKPFGAGGFIPYYQIGGTKPTVHDTMTAGNPLKKMKFSQSFAAADLNKQFYICFVWFDGENNIGPDSPIYS